MQILRQIYKILLITYIFSISSAFAISNELNDVIYGVEYYGNISNNSEITIRINNGYKCELITIDDKKIKNKIHSDNTISFNTKELGENFIDGEMELNCNGNKIIYNFHFPYIDSFSIDKVDSKHLIFIKGQNFLDNYQVVLGNYLLEIINKNDRQIQAIIPNNLKTDKLFVKVGNNKSNFIKLDIKAPKLKYIESVNGFKKGDKLKLFFEDFIFGSDASISLNEKKYNILKKNYKNNYVEIKLDDNLIGKNLIRLEKDGFRSNSLIFEINGERPIINNIIKSIDKKGNKILKIYGKNFINNKNFKIINGSDGTKIKIISSDANQIITKYPNLSIGNNFIYAESNSLFSNIYNIEIQRGKVPFIAKYEIQGLSPDNKFRSIKITVNNFNKKTDSLLINGKNYSSTKYYGGIIKTLLPRNITNGKFEFSRDGKKLNYLKNFDFSYEKAPIIDYIQIIGDINKGAKYIIHGDNFLFADITSSNFIDKNSDGKLNYEISDKKIKGNILGNFNTGATSSINIRNNGLNTGLRFKIEDNIKSYKGIKSFKEILNSKNNIFITKGDEVKVFGKFFHTNDKFYIDDNKLDIKLISPYEIHFKIPGNIEQGIHNLSYLNSLGKKVSPEKIYIDNENEKNNIVFKQEDLEIKNIIVDPITQENRGDFIINYEIDNKIKDITLNKLVFKIKDYKKEKYLGIFKLIYNNKKIGISKVTDNGEIIFNRDIIIKKNLDKKNTLTLKKDGKFIKPGVFQIRLNNIDATYSINGVEKKFNQIDIENLDKKYNVVFHKNINYKCINSYNNLVSCKTITEQTDKNDYEKESFEEYKEENTIMDISEPEHKIAIKGQEYIKQLANSKHKLSRTTKGQKYIKLIDKIANKYKKNLEKLTKLNKKIKILKNKLKNKTQQRYKQTKNIINYLDAKISLELLKYSK